MRLGELAVEVQEVLPAAPERVFALLTDVERVAGLGPEHRQATWAGEDRGVGAVFIGLNLVSDILYRLVDPRAR